MSHPADVATPARSRFLMAALVAILVVVALLVARAPDRFRLQLYDFAEYWARRRSVSSGETPYAPVRVGELEHAIGRDGAPLMMCNPPWTLPLVLPFGLLPARLAHLLWLLLSFGAVLGSADVLWREYGGPV